ncbi:MAG: VCBS repeat-containing protein [Pseudomonadota bacterium]|nr:VCBS repeat-containing protein [Pseudomonadota bacterium]
MFGLSSTFLTQTRPQHTNSTDLPGLDDLFNQSSSSGDNSVTPSTAFGAIAPYGFSGATVTPPPPAYTTFTVNNGGITFVLNFTDADSPTANFENDIINAAKLLSAAVHDKITVNITVGFGEVGGQVLGSGSAAAGPSSGQYETYSDVHAKLLAHAAAGDTNFSSLPSGTTINDQNGNPQTNVAVWNAQLKSLGYISATATGDDGISGFAKDIPDSLMVGVGLHELSHALGRVPFDGGTSQPDIMEFFRYTAPGTRLFFGGTGTASYFSLDGGVTKLANYGVNSDPSDFLNDSLTTNDNFNEFYTGTTLQTLTQLDLTQIDVLGFNAIAKKYAGYDFNGDGVGDIIWHNTDGSLSVWDSVGGGSSFTKITTSGAPTNWSVAGVGDFNADGSADILWHSTSGDISVWDGNGSGGYTKTAIAGAPTNWSVVGVGDFNHDNYSDILWRDTAGDISIWQNNGLGGFSKSAMAGASTNWVVSGVGDFNGDGFSDILWHDNTSGNISIWESNGLGGFTKLALAGAPTSWSVAGVGDFNNDGLADILWHNTSGALSLWDGNGSGGFTKTSIGNPGSAFQVQGVADINGDHMADILLRNSSTGSTLLWASNGSGGFTQSSLGTVATSWTIQGG